MSDEPLIQDAELEAAQRLALACEFRDDDTNQHAQRVGRTAGLLAGELGLSADDVELIRHAAPLHDIGKIGIPDHILLKPGKLDEAEWQTMRRHPVMGHEILKGSGSKYVRMGALIALGHHEKYDGTGYPNGLVGEHIPLCARIIAVADVFDALTSVRPYKAAWPSERAFEYIDEQRGRHFDPRLAAAFMSAKTQILQIQSEWSDRSSQR
jgi:putative nucleotidyltransferase with HDIG domain